MGELFAHFEKKMDNFGKNTFFSRDFSQCREARSEQKSNSTAVYGRDSQSDTFI